MVSPCIRVTTRSRRQPSALLLPEAHGRPQIRMLVGTRHGPAAWPLPSSDCTPGAPVQPPFPWSVSHTMLLLARLPGGELGCWSQSSWHLRSGPCTGVDPEWSLWLNSEKSRGMRRTAVSSCSVVGWALLSSGVYSSETRSHLDNMLCQAREASCTLLRQPRGPGRSQTPAPRPSLLSLHRPGSLAWMRGSVHSSALRTSLEAPTFLPVPRVGFGCEGFGLHPLLPQTPRT